ncbi:MAG: VWA domain-containing protein [Vicinamibacteria bacterium]|nr:VWA domain-containing protein [Vicinamibacteria bacterium]
MRMFSRSSSLLSALVLATTTLAAQTPAGQVPAPPQPSAPADPAVQRPTFRTFIDLVTTDVIVRDGSGQFVADLTKDELDVFEDGVKQEVASVQLVHGGRTFNLQAPPAPPPQEGIILPPARPTNDAAGRIFLFFVDDLHMNFRDTPRIRQLFDKMNKMLLHEGDMFGVVSTGTSSIAIDLTYDKKRMDEAIKKIAGSALKPSEIIEGPQGPNGPSELKYRAHVAFSTAYDIVSNLSKVQNRRKAVIYVSNGYDFNPFEGSRFGDPNIVGLKNDRYNSNSNTGMEYDPFTRQSNQFADADLAHELSELTRAANRANATFYTIDPRGLVAGSDMDEQVDTTEWNNHIRKTQDSLRVIADETGGFAVINQNEFDKALKRIDAESSDYYVLGYYSSNPDPLKRTRKIEVKAKRPNLDIWSRKSYSMKPPPEPKASK